MRKYDIHILPIIASILIAIGPFFLKLPGWTMAWCFFLWIFAIAGLKMGWNRPGRVILTLLTLGSFAALVISFRRNLGSDTYLAVLSVMAALKPLEIRSHRDRMVTIFLSYFIIIANLFYSEDDSLLIIIYMFFSVLTVTAALIHINHPQAAIKSKFRMSGVFILQAVPVMLILFFLFPRIQGNIWGFASRFSGTSGFSDRMSPGSISSIVENNAVAFRVRFEKEIPPPSRLYWRGIVFTIFDGKNWRRASRLMEVNNFKKQESPVNYSITLEPHKQQWLFALDMPGSIPQTAELLNDYTLYSKYRITDRIVYKLTSFTDYNTGTIAHMGKVGLQIPGSGNPQARELAAQWRLQTDSPEEIARMAMDYFKDNDFYYTLQPPLLSENNPVDDFLFNTRQGYCEHYASAFTYLMRAARIPARVVGGYLGGEQNPYGDYMIVRQSDAHAWTEIWIQDRGWVRMDPTSAVSPERVERGVRGSLSDEDLSRIGSFSNIGVLTEILLSAQFGWDMLNAYWTEWFMTYEFENQQELFFKLGIHPGSWTAALKAILLAMVLISFFIILFLASLYYKSENKKDPVKKVYDSFCRKMAKAGIPREPDQGPLTFSEKIVELRHDLKAQIAEITDLYIYLRYGHGQGSKDLEKLIHLVKKFNPHRRQ
ncbi:Transglutamase-like domain-containing protein, DUF3488 and DUF4129 [Desulfonema limicola]|uniref:Transglutamase-like domain-containing protein, DUF3488 and DUF4129 n=1 Tax=Desulfonema limicola TaxID=45656 RepID=A0A975GEJ0_9BACT|nr:DUF3488 and transglutaminase-like domain-containing protein [Desulfonema limicola]QTA78165.1 Transglutamase-like domain-containing protein, DUF3488 and DUF4129 [Desulfonema limicola]